MSSAQNLSYTSKPDQAERPPQAARGINHMRPRMMMNCRESEFIFISSYAVISVVRVEYTIYIHLDLISPLSRSRSLCQWFPLHQWVSTVLYLFRLKQTV